MQTFLPYASFTASARCLDYRRLGKQRLEAKQIIQALEGNQAWANHPATRMWRGYLPALAEYGQVICLEWRERGYVDNLMRFFNERVKSRAAYPEWLGDPAFHASHRSNLLRKDPVYYGAFGWTETPDLEYIWPVKGKV